MRAKSAGAPATVQYPAYGQPQHQGQQAQIWDRQQGNPVNSERVQPFLQDGRHADDPWGRGSTNASGPDKDSDPR